MKSMRVFNYRAGYLAASAALLLATFLPAFASADQVTSRSIQLSSASVNATAVSYTVNFTATKAAGAFVLDFCSDSPVIGQACAAPTGFNASTVATATSGFTIGTLTTPANNKIAVTGAMTAGQNVSVVLTGIANPTAAGPLYARIVTYTNATDAAGYTSANPDVVAAHIDDGGVAMDITPTVGVSGAVLESMTFCVSAALITDDCITTTPPVLKLGEPVGTTTALDSTHLSTGDLYTQISTNATSGAVVNLKSNAAGCGGLINSSNPSGCYILPALKADFAAGTAKFGVKVVATADTGTAPGGVFEAVAASGYNATTYALNYAAADASGITSTFGDPLLDTGGAPANGKNMQLTFGASVSNATPAGNYSADLGMIATGKY
jgi:hypothetical protein